MKLSKHILFLSALVSLSGLAECDAIACASGCQIPFSSIQFNTTLPTDDYYVTQCTNLLVVQSTYLCMRHFCSDTEITAGIGYFTDICETYGFIEPLPWSVINNISDEEAQAYPHITYDDLTAGTIYDTPVSLSDSLFQLAFKTSAQWDHSETTRANYGYAMFGFFAVVFLVSIVYRLGSHFTKQGVLQNASGNDKTSAAGPLRLSLRRYFIYPALFRKHAAQSVGWCTIPPRLQSLTIAAFVIINIVLCCVSYEAFENNLYWPDVQTQIWRYVSDRTGVISMANMPLIFAFGMRNNVLLWLTGWDFSTMNQFHRWVARVATIEAVVHSFGYTIEAFKSGGKEEYLLEWAEEYWWMGVIATIAMSFLCVFSLYPLRKYLYELFLLIHIALAVLFLIGMWYHVAIFNGQYNGFIWPCVAVWVFDRVLRLLRVCYVNILPLRANASYNTDSDVIRLDIPTRSGLGVRPKAGAHYFLYTLHGARFWESHPFTLESWSEDSGSRTILSFMIRPHNGFTARIRDQILKQSNEDTVKNSAQSRSQGEGVFNGSLRVAVEGPYGHSPDYLRGSRTSLRAHSTQATITQNPVLFIIGGSGITVALSHLKSLISCSVSQQQDQQLPTNNRPATPKKLHLIWAVRDSELFRDVYTKELSQWFSSSSAATTGLELQIDVYTTRTTTTISSSDGLKILPKSHAEATVESTRSDGSENSLAGSHSLSDKEIAVEDTAKSPRQASQKSPVSDIVRTSQSLHPSLTISFHYGWRPDIASCVSSAAQENSSGLTVVCCGPAGMLDDTRAATVNALAKGHNVTFWSEIFGW